LPAPQAKSALLAFNETATFGDETHITATRVALAQELQTSFKQYVVCVCVCVCVYVGILERSFSLPCTHTHSHTHRYVKQNEWKMRNSLASYVVPLIAAAAAFVLDTATDYTCGMYECVYVCVGMNDWSIMCLNPRPTTPAVCMCV
jgi:hypothetical protein